MSVPFAAGSRICDRPHTKGTPRTDAPLVLTTTDIPHDITIEGGGHIVHTGSSTAARGGLNLAKPGTFVFDCSVHGHRATGMTGKVIVS